MSRQFFIAQQALDFLVKVHKNGKSPLEKTPFQRFLADINLFANVEVKAKTFRF